ncbi:MAG: hypothetical protein JW986_07765 [Methanotrichaceae archaeon]|nr:hypothetical protein [Methanotrichaceae archaeon]
MPERAWPAQQLLCQRLVCGYELPGAKAAAPKPRPRLPTAWDAIPLKALEIIERRIG